MEESLLQQILTRLEAIEQTLSYLKEQQEEREDREQTFGACLTTLLETNGKLYSNQNMFYNEMMYEIEKQSGLLKSIFKHDEE